MRLLICSIDFIANSLGKNLVECVKMPGPQTRSLEMMVLNAHRAKGVRYPTMAQKDCFKTWYSYALRRGEVEKSSQKEIMDHGKQLKQYRDTTPSGRTYL